MEYTWFTPAEGWVTAVVVTVVSDHREGDGEQTFADPGVAPERNLGGGVATPNTGGLGSPRSDEVAGNLCQLFGKLPFYH